MSISNNISIHALRGEGDEKARQIIHKTNRFQSTPSVGRATGIRHRITDYAAISIHALRGEGDLVILPICSGELISIHALRGEGDACGV